MKITRNYRKGTSDSTRPRQKNREEPSLYTSFLLLAIVILT